MQKRKIESTDRTVDNLIDELYGLSTDEIKIAESRE
jgi:hypothetical protein